LFCFVLFCSGELVGWCLKKEHGFVFCLPHYLHHSPLILHGIQNFVGILKNCSVFLKGFISTQLHTNHLFHALYACGWCYSHGQWNHEGRKMCFLTRTPTTTQRKRKKKRHNQTQSQSLHVTLSFLSSTFSFLDNLLPQTMLHSCLPPNLQIWVQCGDGFD
jgi:hypothetical protein